MGVRHRARLSYSSHFQRVFQRKIWKYSKFFTVVYAQNGLNYSRFGLAVSKRVSKKSVERNRIKRQIREAFFQYQDGFQQPYADFIIIAKYTSSSQKNEVLRRDLHTLLNILIVQ